jgi:hypothetical protein
MDMEKRIADKHAAIGKLDVPDAHRPTNSECI